MDGSAVAIDLVVLAPLDNESDSFFGLISSIVRSFTTAALSGLLVAWLSFLLVLSDNLHIFIADATLV